MKSIEVELKLLDLMVCMIFLSNFPSKFGVILALLRYTEEHHQVN